MKIDPVTLKYLLESMSEGVREMHLLLRGSITPQTVPALARVAHKLKGEATVVGLANLSRLITNLEDGLERLQTLKGIDKPHLQVVGLHLKKIVKVCEQVRQNAISVNTQAPAKRVQAKKSNPLNKANGITATLQILAQNVARSSGKQVTLNLERFNISDIPESMHIKVQDIAIQLIRNAIAHGIEVPLERKDKAKPPVGVVGVVTKRTKNTLAIAVRDNGKGIDLEEIRKRLIVKYDCSVIRAAKMSRETLLNSLFLPGFSTLADKQHHAGRGVGLDLVKEHAKSLGGKVDVTYELNRYTQFVVQIPLEQKAKVKQLNAIPLLLNPINDTAQVAKRRQSRSSLRHA